jgi:protein gp37
MQKTAISWTQQSWNPTFSCSKVSDGCRFCYAETIALKYKQSEKPWTVPNEKENVQIKPHKLKEPYTLKEDSLVFMNSTSDAHHRVIPDWFRAAMWCVMLDLPQHQFQVLTKRADALPDWHERFLAAVRSKEFKDFAATPKLDKRVKAALLRAEADFPTPWGDNIWQGVSVEDARVIKRIDHLKACGAKIKFISAEPLLGSWGDVDLRGIDQVLVGGESGTHLKEEQEKHRWIQMVWAREILAICLRDGVAYFFKQDSGYVTEQRPYLIEEDGSRWQWHQFPGDFRPPILVDAKSQPIDRPGMSWNTADPTGDYLKSKMVGFVVAAEHMVSMTKDNPPYFVRNAQIAAAYWRKRADIELPPSTPPKPEASTIKVTREPVPVLPTPTQQPLFSIKQPAWVALLPATCPRTITLPTIEGEREATVIASAGAFVMHQAVGGKKVKPDHWTITHAASLGAFVQGIPGRAAAERLLMRIGGIDMTGYEPMLIKRSDPPDILKQLFAVLRVWAIEERLPQFDPLKLPNTPRVGTPLPVPVEQSAPIDAPTSESRVVSAVPKYNVDDHVVTQPGNVPGIVRTVLADDRYEVFNPGHGLTYIHADWMAKNTNTALIAEDGPVLDSPVSEVVATEEAAPLVEVGPQVLPPWDDVSVEQHVGKIGAVEQQLDTQPVEAQPDPLEITLAAIDPLTISELDAITVVTKMKRIVERDAQADHPLAIALRNVDMDTLTPIAAIGVLMALKKPPTPAAAADPSGKGLLVGATVLHPFMKITGDIISIGTDLAGRIPMYNVKDAAGTVHHFGGGSLEVVKPAPVAIMSAPQVQAFTAQQIVAAVQGALRSRAITETWTLSLVGRTYHKNADEIRWSDERNQAEVNVGGEWYRVTARGIGRWAQQEHLNWRRDDGTVWLHDQDIMTLEGEEWSGLIADPPPPVVIPRISVDDVPEGAMVLSLWQPWASLIFCPPNPDSHAITRGAAKEIETRNWKPNQKLPITLVIHAAKTQEEMNRLSDSVFRNALVRGGFEGGESDMPMSFGAALGVVELVEVIPVTVAYRSDLHQEERFFGNYAIEKEQRYAWVLRNPRMFDKPLPMKGQQGMWKWEQPGAAPAPVPPAAAVVASPIPSTPTRVIRVQDAPFDWKADPQHVYIGRKMGGQYKLDDSPFGNPFRLEHDTPEGRAEGIEKYRRHILPKLHFDPKFRAQFDALKGKTLVCWCHPKACHGDLLAEWLEHGVPELDDELKAVAVETSPPTTPPPDEQVQLMLFDLPPVNAKSSFAA